MHFSFPNISVETRPITPALDPYAEFLQNQKKREANWKAERAAKRTRLRKSEETERETPQICLDVRVKRNIEASSDEVRQLKQQLDEKKREVEMMAIRAEELKEANRLAAETRLLREDFYKAGFNFVFPQPPVQSD